MIFNKSILNDHCVIKELRSNDSPHIEKNVSTL